MTIDIHSLLAPYALNALDPDERARFEAHIAQCDDCSVELPGLLTTAGRMGAAAEQRAPDELRDRLMAIVARTPQERPVVTAMATHSRVRRALPRMLVAASMLVALAGVGAFAVERNHSANLQAQQTGMTAVLSSADANTKDMKIDGSGSVRVIESKSSNGAVLLTNGIRKISDKTYQLWTIEAGKARSQGLIKSGSGAYLVKNLGSADTIAITVEPAGGSEQPTTAPVMAASV